MEPWRDPIVAEVRQVREELFAAAGYHVQELCRRLRERGETSGHPVIRDTRPAEAEPAGRI